MILSDKKNGNTISILLSVIFGVTALAFIGLTVITVSAKGSIKSAYETAKNYILSDSVKTDVLSENLSSVVTNDEKRAKSYPEGILDSLKAAYAINNNLVGRLRIPGTELDTVVTQCNDNSHYLTYSFYEKSTSTGSPNYGNPFLDYRCRNDGSLSKNMIIHAHTTGKSDGVPKQSFRSLYNYQKMDYFKKHPIIKFSTLTGEYTYKIYAVFYSTTQEKADNGYFFNYIYPDMSDSNMEGYIEQVNERRLYDTGVTLESTDKIITLSTCIYVYGSYDTRLVVVGRLLHDGESEEVDTSLVKDNPDYRRPQYWYTANGKTNPYANSAKWEPSAE